MKIAIITDVVYPDYTGGTSLVPYNLIKSLDKNKFKVTLIGSKFRESNLNHLRGFYFNIPLFLLNETPLGKFFNQFKIKRFLAKEKFDLIHFESLPGLRFCFLPSYLKKKGVPLIQTIHGLPEIEVNFKVKNWFLRKLYLLNWKLSVMNIKKNYDVVLVNSLFMKKSLTQLGKIKVIPNGINSNLWKGEIIKSSFNNKTILFWGRLSPEKGVEELIKAMPKILEEFQNTRLIIIGDGPQRRDIEKMIRESNLSNNINLLGMLKQKEIAKISSKSSVLVFPSLYEPFGMMVIEGMANGKAIVSSNSGGLKELIKNNYNGILIEPKSEEISREVIRVLKNKDLSLRLGKNARKFIKKKFDWSKVIKQYEELYKKVISNF